MRIIVDRPPNFDEIDAAFNVSNHPVAVIFCYGDVIYNPKGAAISRHLVEHERVHSAQQGDDPTGWWLRYIDDPAFRLSQEIPAHLAELRSMNRATRRVNLGLCARRLSGSLYGRLITFDAARKLLKDGCAAGRASGSMKPARSPTAC